MSKINETLRSLQAGARNNKYRVIYPVLGRDLDIACNATTNPGRELGTVDVFIKGRKVQYAAEGTDEGTWELTMYNDPTLQHRNFFLEMINVIHSFAEPQYLSDNGGIQNSNLGVNALNIGSSAQGSSNLDFSGWGKLGNFVNKVSSAVNAANTAYNNITNTFAQFQRVSKSVQDFTSGDLTALQEIFNINSYQRPWYMTEIIVEQLDNVGNSVSTTILHNAFISNVGPIEYSDETGDISTTTITFTYSGISYR